MANHNYNYKEKEKNFIYIYITQMEKNQYGCVLMIAITFI